MCNVRVVNILDILAKRRLDILGFKLFLLDLTTFKRLSSISFGAESALTRQSIEIIFIEEISFLRYKPFKNMQLMYKTCFKTNKFLRLTWFQG